MIVTGHKQYAW